MDSIFSLFNMGRLKVVGYGASNVCFTDGEHAIKIGQNSRYDANMLNQAHKHGFAPKVIAQSEDVAIPDYIVELMFNALLNPLNGDQSPWSDLSWYASKRMGTWYASVMIVEYVKPFLSHKKKYSPRYQNRAYKLAEELKEKYESVSGVYWGDNHPWNMGKAKDGRLLIIDF